MFHNSIFQDKIFNLYKMLPHCKVMIARHKKAVRRKLDPLAVQDISVISTNCVGGEICYLAGIEFQSPMVNISMNRNQFVLLCEHLKEYFTSPIRVVKTEEGCCVGRLECEGLETISIRFPHDDDPEKVTNTWNRRCKRVHYDRLVLITDDRGMEEESFRRFDHIHAYRKICLTANDRSAQYDWCHQLKCYEGLNQVGSYNGKSLDGMWKFVKMWDYCSFINGA